MVLNFGEIKKSSGDEIVYDESPFLFRFTLGPALAYLTQEIMININDN